MWSTNQLSKFRQLSWSERGLLLEAALWLAFIRVALLLVPFRRIAPRLGTLQHESDRAVPPAAEQAADRVGWAVQAVARRTPWESACLAQAISAKAMLRRRHIQSTLYLGLAKDSSQSLQAHAWLRCGEAILTGKSGHERYTILSSFAEPTAVTPQNFSPAPANDTIESEAVASLLLAVLNPVPQVATTEKLRQLRKVEWDALVKAAVRQRVLTLFLARLQTLEVETAVPPHLLTKMQQKHQQITLQNLSMYRELRLINEKMQAENVPLIVLKGAYLATAVYPHIGQRPMGDLDLLVPYDRLDQAVELLHAVGWQEIRPFSLAANLAHQHHLPPFAHKTSNLLVELHWNISRPQHSHAVPPEQLWEATIPFKAAGTTAVVFPPHVQLLHLAIHAAYNHQFAFDLRSLCDIAVLIGHTQLIVDWEQLETNAKRWQWERGVYLTLKLVQEFWDTAVPPHVLSQLQPEQMPENLTQLAKQQLLWGRSNNLEVSKNFSQLKGSKTTLEKARFILSFFFPARTRLSWQYGVPLQSPKIWLYYFINWGKLITRNARRTWHLLTGQSRVTTAVNRRNQLAEWLANTK